ncbi:MAG: M14 family metallopeptidase [Candidatus Calescibacterium sp.]|nr:M14 family metallopeptidase [Candidatus Calescibacterium sp.]MCX7972136.1 M14 family metallopeptidase [bacterium]MDW8194824.1 M14 family metallopeptidase [Candidatus Calescibacterium sp.]
MTYILRIDGKIAKIPPKYNHIAQEIDQNQNKIISNQEIKDFLIKNDEVILKKSKRNNTILNENEIIKEFKQSLLDNLRKDFIRDYNQILESIKKLQEKYLDKVKVEYIGKTHEGRDIVAIKISTSNKEDKKSLLITGLHHAREWATAESALNIAEKLLEQYDTNQEVKNLLDNTVLHIIPVVNPDGYEYSLKTYSWWRKNRKPTEKAIGVDLNRNYYTDKNPELYRPANDKPDSTLDDYGASDNPYSDTYRGPYGKSENEIQAIEKYTQENKINAVIDLHSYGNMILFPWGHTHKPTQWDKIYREVAQEMSKKVMNKYRVMQSIELYPTTGCSTDYHHMEGRFSYTLEIGRSFFPKDKEELESIKNETLEMVKVFMSNLVSGKIPTQSYTITQA